LATDNLPVGVVAPVFFVGGSLHLSKSKEYH
jgi:hypothetical protein